VALIRVARSTAVISPVGPLPPIANALSRTSRVLITNTRSPASAYAAARLVTTVGRVASAPGEATRMICRALGVIGPAMYGLWAPLAHGFAPLGPAIPES